jgi:hypothetical protein
MAPILSLVVQRVDDHRPRRQQPVLVPCSPTGTSASRPQQQQSIVTSIGHFTLSSRVFSP